MANGQWQEQTQASGNGNGDLNQPAGMLKFALALSEFFWQINDRIGRRCISVFVYTLKVLQMVYLCIRAAFFDQSQGLRTVFGVLSAQIYFTGWQALPLMTVLGLATGSIAILQSATQLSFLGQSSMLGQLLVVIIVRELGPLVTALIVIARSGTAVASEIGNMRVNREIDALEMMGINPLSFIVFPRIIGGVISVLCLSFYFDVISIFGGFFATKALHNVPFAFFLNSLTNALSKEDVFLFLIKNIFSGLIIFVVSCHQGFLVKQSSHEVPQVTTKAVVNSIIYVTTFNLSVTLIFYVTRLMSMGLI
jgi:phospholipid/cholesterol/gamma-HCH transport system permease protein